MKIIPILVLLISTVQLKAQTVDSANDLNEINTLINNFQAAIEKKDSVLFFSVFFDRTTPIIGVMSDSTEMSIKKDNAHFQGLTVSNSERFIREICNSAKQQSEIFVNTQIQLDDRIATVRFDYAFFADSKMYQWGEESWALAFAEGQWFITGINFTIRFPTVEKPPKELSR